MATEKRLIDVNKVIDQMQKCIDESPYARDSIASYTFGAIIEALKKEPTVDAVEVVRCKDCYHNEQCICVCCEDGEMIKCGLHHKHMDADGYCHEGRRC